MMVMGGETADVVRHDVAELPSKKIKGGRY
jgi:hypothetical protein